MKSTETFFDTNVLLYLLSADRAKADRAEECIAEGGTISVQVLNEFASVASRKLRMDWTEIRECLEPIRAISEIVPLTLETHDEALAIAERNGLSFDDALIIASAELSGCSRVLSEDLNSGQIIGSVEIRNPFLSISMS